MKKFFIIFIVFLVIGVGLFLGVYEKGELGDNVTYTLNRITGKVVISGTGEMWDEHGEPFNDNIFLKSAVIEEGVTNIAPKLFRMTDITSVTIPDSVTSIGSEAFASTNITNISIPNVVVIEEYAFFSCYDLTSVELSEGLQSIGWDAFRDCANLTLISLPSTLTEIGQTAFNGCSSLRSIIIPDSITELTLNSFGNCTALEELTIGSSVNLINFGAFSNCSNLKNIYYKGTRQQWSAVALLDEEAQKYFNNATMHFAE